MGKDRELKHSCRFDNSSVSFLERNGLHEIKLRYPKLKTFPAEKRIRDLYCGFTDDTIDILGKIIVRTQYNGWIS